MYTKQYDNVVCVWDLYSPDGEHLISTSYEEKADLLLAHLNR